MEATAVTAATAATATTTAAAAAAAAATAAAATTVVHDLIKKSEQLLFPYQLHSNQSSITSKESRFFNFMEIIFKAEALAQTHYNYKNCSFYHNKTLCVCKTKKTLSHYCSCHPYYFVKGFLH